MKVSLQYQARALCIASALGLLAVPCAMAQSIFTCVDAHGRVLTSDRVIAACADREQKELGSDGIVRRVIKPTMTADEAAAYEAKQKVESEARAKVEERKRRDRALLARYPNQAVQDKERADTLSQLDALIAGATQRLVQLFQQKQTLETETEFYKKNPENIPAALKAELRDNQNSIEEQKRYITSQAREKIRVNERFDADLVRLKPLWASMIPLVPSN